MILCTLQLPVEMEFVYTGIGAITWEETNIQVTSAAFKNAPR